MDSTDDRCRPIRPLAGSKWATNADSAPSRIMLGGAVLKSGQCNPPAIICLRRRSKVQRPGAVEAALFVDLVALMLLSRRALFTRLGRSANDVTGYFRIPTGRGSKTIQGHEPHKFRLNCRWTATASLFLCRNRTSDSPRIPVWISL